MDNYLTELERELVRLGKSEAFIKKCCQYAQELLERKKPVLFDAKHVDKVLKMEGVKTNAYHFFDIGNGRKSRYIESPSVSLKKRQKWIAINILQSEELGNWIHGYVKEKSIVSSVRVHVGKKRILRLDIKSFFPSINSDMVEKLFHDMGYSKSAAERLTYLCTFSWEKLYDNNIEIPEEYQGKSYLPHGAPSSPILANLVFQKVDLVILEAIKEYDIQYSRYADDLIFSSDTDDLQWLIERIREILAKYNFKINNNKTKLMTENDPKLLMGLNITKGIKIQKRYKRKLYQEIYFCKKYGVREHLERTDSNGRANFAGYLYGKAYFINMVEPELGAQMLEELDKLFSQD